MPDRDRFRILEDEAYFREAVAYTAAATGFLPGLIEKDAFATALLAHLAERCEGLAFRGGTCLAKVEVGFYRLSEDLDFAISLPVEARKRERSAEAAPLRRAIECLERDLPFFTVSKALDGANASRQYLAEVAYRSRLTESEGTLQVEVGLREPFLEPPDRRPARTLLLDPVTREPALEPVSVLALSAREIWAEKLRAALSRREPAIRDFYDVDHSARVGALRLDEPALVEAVRAKLAVPGNFPIDVSRDRLEALRRQVRTRLEPVLRPPDLESFDLDRAFGSVAELARRLREEPAV